MLVTLADGRRMSMRDLIICDVVLTGPVPSDVAAILTFAHRELNAIAAFVRVTLDKGALLLLTAAHHIAANGGTELICNDLLRAGEKLPANQCASSSPSTTSYRAYSTIYRPPTEMWSLRGLSSPPTRKPSAMQLHAHSSRLCAPSSNVRASRQLFSTCIVGGLLPCSVNVAFARFKQ